MSSELLTLIKKIQPTPAPAKKKPPEPSIDMLNLLQRVENRKWKVWKQSELLARLEELYGELRFIDHAMKCEQCLMELCLDVTRYNGRLCPWYLNLEYEAGWYPDVYEEDPLYKTAPRIDKYKWGSYWKKTINHEEAIRFIKDRMKWAKPIIQKEAEAVVDFYVALENWDLLSPLANEPEPFLYFWGVENEQE